MFLATATLLFGCDQADHTDAQLDAEVPSAVEGESAEEQDDLGNLPVEESEEITWDASPPEEIQDGAELEVTIQCGLMNGSGSGIFVKDGDRWNMAYMDMHLLTGLEACSDESAPVYLEWDDVPSMYIDAGGYDHHLTPMADEDTWIGEVWPRETPSEACQAGLDSLGITFPVTMTMTVDSLTL